MIFLYTTNKEMYFTFKLEKDIEQAEFSLEEGNGFKPIQHYLEEFGSWPNCKIYCDHELLFSVRYYGKRAYVSRYYNDEEILHCTLYNGQLYGHTFLYKQGKMAYILKYNHHNLDGDQLSLATGYKVTSKNGELIKDIRSSDPGNKDILFAHELVLALIKWY